MKPPPGHMIINMKTTITTIGSHNGVIVQSGIQSGPQRNRNGAFDNGPSSSVWTPSSFPQIDTPGGIHLRGSSSYDPLPISHIPSTSQDNLHACYTPPPPPPPPLPPPRHYSPPPSPVLSFRRDSPPDEFIQPSKVTLNVFNPGDRDPLPISTSLRPCASESADALINDAVTTTTTVEVFRTPYDPSDPHQQVLLPPPPAPSIDSRPQLLRLNGPEYEKWSNTRTETLINDRPIRSSMSQLGKAVQWKEKLVEGGSEIKDPYRLTDRSPFVDGWIEERPQSVQHQYQIPTINSIDQRLLNHPLIPSSMINRSTSPYIQSPSQYSPYPTQSQSNDDISRLASPSHFSSTVSLNANRPLSSSSIRPNDHPISPINRYSTIRRYDQVPNDQSNQQNYDYIPFERHTDYIIPNSRPINVTIERIDREEERRRDEERQREDERRREENERRQREERRREEEQEERNRNDERRRQKEKEERRREDEREERRREDERAADERRRRERRASGGSSRRSYRRRERSPEERHRYRRSESDDREQRSRQWSEKQRSESADRERQLSLSVSPRPDPNRLPGEPVTAKSTEIFALYQTRDAMQNIVAQFDAMDYELDDRLLLLTPLAESEDSLISELSSRADRCRSDYLELYPAPPIDIQKIRSMLSDKEIVYEQPRSENIYHTIEDNSSVPIAVYDIEEEIIEERIEETTVALRESSIVRSPSSIRKAHPDGLIFPKITSTVPTLPLLPEDSEPSSTRDESGIGINLLNVPYADETPREMESPIIMNNVMEKMEESKKALILERTISDEEEEWDLPLPPPPRQTKDKKNNEEEDVKVEAEQKDIVEKEQQDKSGIVLEEEKRDVEEKKVRADQHKLVVSGWEDLIPDIPDSDRDNDSVWDDSE